MNIQIQSNSKNKVGGTNKINQFHMRLIEPIDAENQAKYIVPLCVSYPLTTKNIEKDKCFFYVEFQFGKAMTVSKKYNRRMALLLLILILTQAL